MFKKYFTGIFAIIILYILVVNCGKDTKNPTEPGSTIKEDPSFVTDIQPIFSASCATSGCHNVNASGGLDLSAGKAYINLVDVASSLDKGKKRVKAGDATNSYLVIKIEGKQSVGSKMPPSGGVSTESIQLIKNWINKGAKNN
ncbi:hypothetical protein JW964_24655 [candidate division KSB1 bacterium]|nr:hypothetical protein [candidate division KSB1 bacterium]